jgi:hypothetical protein
MAVVDDITMRSTLEARWAVFFDELGLSWEYEPERFRFGKLIYTPDFLLPGLGYVEIKPSLDLFIEQTSNRLKAFSRAFPNKEIYVCLGEGVNLNETVKYKGGKIYAPTFLQMAHALIHARDGKERHQQNEVLSVICHAIKRASDWKANHFVSTGAILALEVIPETGRCMRKQLARARSRRQRTYSGHA